jgi:hypothetical protein
MVKILRIVLILSTIILGKTYNIGLSNTWSDFSDTIAAANVSSNLDTILIPDGWDVGANDSATAVMNPLVIFGPGIDRMSIRDSTPVASDRPVITIGSGLSTDELFHMRGVSFKGPGGGWEGFVLVKNSTSQNIVFEECSFDSSAGRLFRVQADANGVLSRCRFIGAEYNNMLLFEKTAEGMDSSWSQTSGWGSRNFWFIEDCSVIKTQGWNGGNTVDANFGARYVYRSCFVDGQVGFGHGPCYQADADGTRAMEIYKNVCINSGDMHEANRFRAGTALVYNNSFLGTITGMIFAIDYRRSCNDIADDGTHDACVPHGWGRCDGGDPIDGNDSTTGYPCFAAPGRGEDQRDEPLLFYANDSLGIPCGGVLFDDDNCSNPSMEDHLQEGRDWFNDTNFIDAGWYTPYMWPHDLVSIPPACSTSNVLTDTISTGDIITLLSLAAIDQWGQDSSGFYNRTGRNMVVRVETDGGYDTLVIDTIFQHNGTMRQDSVRVTIGNVTLSNGMYALEVINGDGVSYTSRDSVYFRNAARIGAYFDVVTEMVNLTNDTIGAIISSKVVPGNFWLVDTTNSWARVDSSIDLSAGARDTLKYRGPIAVLGVIGQTRMGH